MKATEKAKELVNKFTYEISAIDIYNYCLESHIRYTAKECALIAVNTILNDYKDYKLHANTDFKGLGYWQEVKQEIGKL